MADYRAEVEAYMTANHPDATGAALRARGLSDTVMQRHAKFVDHYESNWAELTRNLNTVASSNNANAYRANAGKALGHLNRVRPPKRHVPLDPNNLPHRAVKEQPADVEDYTPRRIQFTPISQGLYADPVRYCQESFAHLSGGFSSACLCLGH
jgi:hypothetical protein